MPPDTKANYISDLSTAMVLFLRNGTVIHIFSAPFVLSLSMCNNNAFSSKQCSLWMAKLVYIYIYISKEKWNDTDIS